MASQFSDGVHDEADLRRYYDAFYQEGDFAHYPERTDLAFFHAIFMYFKIPERARVLDAGTGSGVRLLRMRKLDFDATGMDLSIEGLRICRHVSSEAPLVQADILRQPFRNGAFQAVIALGCSVMNAGSDKTIESMVRECLRATSPGGWVIATTVTDFSGGIRGGWRQQTRAELETLCDTLCTSTGAAARAVLYTAPGIAARAPRLAIHPLTSALFRRLPRYKRTVILAWKK